jgi:hypothetical protein
MLQDPFFRKEVTGSEIPSNYRDHSIASISNQKNSN